jgi:hypothetical protein
MSQLLTSFDLLDYGQLNYVSLAGVIVAFGISVFLPKVTSSIYFYRGEDDGAQWDESISKCPKHFLKSKKDS